ncbi:uncharacterized protein E0L32_007346 [Thyridium curvatum]|uniref:Defect at low temperature protein 1 n=1 Tax=Thyridium curvatum TaxID=1093900 RepID=A0A507B4Q2_9PEZI|nr:uncharacterized protein E0L32_007346 [Thyridium curvatum]TPX11848.1 hypothetical protein E0L32_007346 [Thyridium curvatum]
MAASSKLFFRIIYGTFYTFLHILLLVLLLVIPGDIVNQGFKRNNFYPLFIVIGGYGLTIVVVVFVYFMRLYVNRSVLNSIPKSWIPIEKGDVHKDVRKMIVLSLSRSAAIAFAARPRVAPPALPQDIPAEVDEVYEEGEEAGRKSTQASGLKKEPTVEDEMGIHLPTVFPVWGEIEHYGWSSPELLDLPNLQYSSVISELPNLIEAKALTLAPPDPMAQTDPPGLDPEAVGLLQRPANMALREYLSHLVDIGVLEALSDTADFISLYEYARFCTRPISNASFRALMRHFAEVLRSMQPLDPAVLADLLLSEDDASFQTRSEGGGADSLHDLHIPRSHDDSSSIAGSFSTSSSGSHVWHRPSQPNRTPSANTWTQYRTAPTTPKSRMTALSRTSSISSFAQTRHPYPVSQPSSASLRSGASGDSVIRLSDRRDPGDLPYVLSVPSMGTDTLDFSGPRTAS